jgi:two-component system sensor histidine kinase CiaH
MFESARIKLTLWYTLIIFIVSVLFSFGVFRVTTNELKQNLSVQAFRMMPRHQQDALLNRYPQLADLLLSGQTYWFQERPTIGILIDDTLYTEGKRRIAAQLIFINTVITMTAAVLSYALSGRTLAPIASVMEEQKRFVADASHELRTPLTSLKTEIEVALRDKKMKLKEAKELLESNLEEVDKMQHLSNYLLSLSRYQSGTMQLPFTKVDLKDIAEKAAKKQVKNAKEKNIEINLELTPAKTEGNAVSLEELVGILIDNAIKYSTKDGKITVRTFYKNRHAVLEVQDTGIGIKASDILHIFNRFYRADTSRSKTTIAGGYGLGLAIAKSIVDLHNGTIDVKSKVGQGTLFSVKL